MVMEGKEGIETIQEFRKRYPAVRIVAMSGGGRGDSGTYLRLAKHLGAAVTLSKPFSLDDLSDAIGMK
jgi:DNA-binding NarL/FixJ family response regulator